MSAEPAIKMTELEYLIYERQAEYKSEFLNGKLFAMAGASRRHNLIVTNVVREVSLQLKGRSCESYSSDMRVHNPDTSLYSYPDVVVMCGKPEFSDEHGDILLNPTLLIEVLSPSTELYDRGAKFGHYRRLESLREYVMITQDRASIERYERQEDSRFWMLSEIEGLETSVELSSIGCTLALSEVYDKVDFEHMEE